MFHFLYTLAKMARDSLKGLIKINFVLEKRKVQSSALLVLLESGALLVMTKDGHSVVLSQKAALEMATRITNHANEQKSRLN